MSFVFEFHLPRSMILHRYWFTDLKTLTKTGVATQNYRFSILKKIASTGGSVSTLNNYLCLHAHGCGSCIEDIGNESVSFIYTTAPIKRAKRLLYTRFESGVNGSRKSHIEICFEYSSESGPGLTHLHFISSNSHHLPMREWAKWHCCEKTRDKMLSPRFHGRAPTTIFYLF